MSVTKPETKNAAAGPKDKPAAKKAMADAPTKTDKADKPAPDKGDKTAPDKGDKVVPEKSDKAAEAGAATADKATEAADPAVGFSRGEGQKPVSPRYRNNWDQVFGKKKK